MSTRPFMFDGEKEERQPLRGRREEGCGRETAMNGGLSETPAVRQYGERGERRNQPADRRG